MTFSAAESKRSVLQRLAHALVSRPFVYDLVQSLAGQGRVAERLRAALDGLPQGRLLDVGSAGGGFARRLGVDPIYLDLDPRALSALRRRRAARAVVGDAARLPFPDACFDATLCLAVFHHLDDGTLPFVVAELSRVTSGHLILLDPVRNDSRRLSRWLWRYDRGSFPRRSEALLASLEQAFELSRVLEFSLYHQYLMCTARPRSAAPREGSLVRTQRD